MLEGIVGGMGFVLGCCLALLGLCVGFLGFFLAIEIACRVYQAAGGSVETVRRVVLGFWDWVWSL